MNGQDDARLEYLPPRSARNVTIGGFEVPHVEAREVDNGVNTNVILDGRFFITIPAEHAESVIWLLANAIAIGAGYSCHGENSIYRPNPFKVRAMCVGSATDQDGNERPVGNGE